MLALQLVVGVLLGFLVAFACRPFAALEVPLSTTNLVPVLAYLLVMRGALPQLGAFAAGRALGAGVSGRLGIVMAVTAGIALDPATHGYWAFAPLRALPFWTMPPLLALPWVLGATRRTLGAAAWRGGMMAILDRERGPAVGAVEGLLALVIALEAYRAVRSARMTPTMTPTTTPTKEP